MEVPCLALSERALHVILFVVCIPATVVCESDEDEFQMTKFYENKLKFDDSNPWI